MGRKHKSFPREAGESGEVRELKQKIKRLSSDKKRLIAELKTLQDALDRTNKFLSKKVEDISLQDLTKMHNKTLKQIEDIVTCKKCGSPKYSYIVLPNSNRVKVCTNCGNRELINDINEINSIEEII